MEELKPCPFCGGEANLFSEESIDGGYGHWVICQSCGAKALTYYDVLYKSKAKEYAVNTWNRRPIIN